MTELERLQFQHNMQNRNQANYDPLMKALGGIDLIEQETSTLAWLSTCESSTVNNLRSIIEKIKMQSAINHSEGEK